ncbi:hypothetical protein XCM_2215 [Xanthomonas citri pv. mangiferaeindicae]|nr:hypothetical protein XCM_2215 [Xanthomonas citri pv. mangiferaeindicae]
MLIAELGGCLPAEPMQSLLDAGNQPSVGLSV